MAEAKQRELLLALRGKMCGVMHMQPFKVYTDKNIEDLLKVKPKTIADLTKVSGFPEDGKRVKGFGKAIIAIFNNNRLESIDIKGTGKAAEVVTVMKPMTIF